MSVSPAASAAKADAAELRLPRVASPPQQQSASSSSHHPLSPPLPRSDFADTVNPFLAPNEELFAVKSRDQQQKAEAKHRTSSPNTWHKPSAQPTQSAEPSSTTPAATSTSSTYVQRKAARNAFMASSLSSSACLPSSSSADVLRSSTDAHFCIPSSVRYSDKLNMSQFIAQKRDMFLLHMSLQTKRAEITKLEEKALMKEQALRRAEQMLEEDAMRFDAFLKENDRRAHESLKRADKESKEKTEKLVEMKRVNADIAKVEADMAKYDEQLVTCIKYKHFLDGLTDPKWLEREEKKRQERREERRKKKEGSRKAKLKGKERPAAGAGGGSERAAADGSLASHRGSTRRGDLSSRGNRLTVTDEKEWSGRARADTTTSSHRSGSGRPTTSSSSLSSSDSDSDSGSDEEPMYFTSPQQLLDLFSQLEERNLFLIQNVQETEESLDEMRVKYAEMELDMNDKSALLQASIDDMRRKIDKEHDKTAQLTLKKSVMGIIGAGGMDAEKVVDGLREQVRAVYKKSGFDGDSGTDTLDMLRDIEGWLEHLLHEMKTMDPLKVEQAEKRKNAERRTMIRQAKKEEQKRMYEERLAKSTARATAEVVRHTGKPVMFRSAPLRRKVKEENVQQVDEEAEELASYFK